MDEDDKLSNLNANEVEAGIEYIDKDLTSEAKDEMKDSLVSTMRPSHTRCQST